MQLTTGILVLTSLINFHRLTTTPLLSPKPIILFTLSIVLSHLTVPSSQNYFIYISCQNLLTLPTAVKSGAPTCFTLAGSATFKQVYSKQLSYNDRLISLKLLPLSFRLEYLDITLFEIYEIEVVSSS